jgi:hypothetical protein
VAVLAQPFLVGRAGHLGDAVRRRPAPRADRGGPRGLRRQRGHLSPDRAGRVPGRGGQPGGARHPARTKRPCRTRR